MTHNRPAYYRMLASLFVLALLCTGLVNLCGWLSSWCPNATPVKQIVLATGLAGIGLLAITQRVRRTSHRITPFLAVSQTEFSPFLRKVITECGLDSSHVILIRSSRPLAFCFGFWRPRICLSTGFTERLSPPQLRAVLLHEDYHRRRFDPLRILLVDTLGAALFFLPAVQEWREVFKTRLELDADRYAAHKAGKAALAGALHCLLTYSSSSLPMTGMITAELGANATRIAALLDEHPTPQRVSRRSLLQSAAVIWIICLLLMV